MPIFARHGVNKPQIAIRKMKTLWGSCSKHLNKITFNEYLLKADIRCIEYVVFHELTHLIYNAHCINISITKSPTYILYYLIGDLSIDNY